MTLGIIDQNNQFDMLILATGSIYQYNIGNETNDFVTVDSIIFRGDLISKRFLSLKKIYSI